MYNKNKKDSVPSLTSERIRQRRIELGLTQKEVANKMGVADGSVCRWETGVRGGMNPETIRKLAAILDCDANYLAGTEIRTQDEVKDTLFQIIDRMNKIEQSELLRYCMERYGHRVAEEV